MAWTKKISSVIKGRINSGASQAKGFIDNMAGNLTGEIDKFTSAFSGVADINAAKAKAKNIINSSPLEIGAGGAVQKSMAESGRYNYGTIYYPEETSNLDEGHYVIIDVVAHDKSSFNKSMNRVIELPDGKVGTTLPGQATSSNDLAEKSGMIKDAESARQKHLRTMSSGIGQGGSHTHTRITDSICLYTPADAVKFTYKANYEMLATGLAGLFASSMERGKSMSIKEAILQGGGATLERVLGEAVTGIASALPGVGDVRGAIDKSMGRALNPFNEQVFRSVPFREFPFPFEFAPKNRKEMENVHKIIKLLKFHMLPEFSNKTYSAFLSPSEFQITYMYRSKMNSYIPLVSRCVLTSMEVDYANEGAFHTFREDDKGAAPVITKVTCNFAETEIMTKETIAQGH
tara:strand:- start:1773 stop:2984 length:1212 start_codon:yes stop_codon:yes gene_type:complete